MTLKKIWIFVLVGFLLIVTATGLGGKMYMDKRAEEKDAEKIAIERKSVEALKETFKDIKSIEIEKSMFDEMTGAFDVFVKMTNQENKSVRFSYTYWKDGEKLGSIGIEDIEIQSDGVTENKILVIYSNKKEDEI